jgi:hypothetical protein
MSSVARKTPAPATQWPKSRIVDGWRWELGPEPADDGTAHPEPPADDRPEEWDFPPRRQVSPVELSMLAAHSAI